MATPSTPVQVLGFASVPSIGDLVTTVPGLAVTSTLTVLGKTTSTSEVKQANVIIKADVAGSLEAILGSLPENVNVISSSVGGVTESDIQQAIGNQAVIVCFNVKAAGTVAKLASVEKVKVISLGIIYELFDYLKALVEEVQKEGRVEVVSEAKVLKPSPSIIKLFMAVSSLPARFVWVIKSLIVRSSACASAKKRPKKPRRIPSAVLSSSPNLTIRPETL